MKVLAVFALLILAGCAANKVKGGGASMDAGSPNVETKLTNNSEPMKAGKKKEEKPLSSVKIPGSLSEVVSSIDSRLKILKKQISEQKMNQASTQIAYEIADLANAGKLYASEKGDVRQFTGRYDYLRKKMLELVDALKENDTPIAKEVQNQASIFLDRQKAGLLNPEDEGGGGGGD